MVSAVDSCTGITERGNRLLYLCQATLNCTAQNTASFRIHISIITIFYKSNSHTGTFRWPCGLGLRSEASRLLGLRIRIPPMGRMFVCCVCCALCRWRHMRRADHSFRRVLPGVCVCVCVCLCVCACVSSCMCDQGISTLRQPMPEISCCAREISHRKRRKLKM